jgi:phage/plasmid-like protein (TIGR03299 family)
MTDQNWSVLGFGNSDGMATARTPNPYGLGIMLPNSFTVEEAMVHAELDYGPHSRDLFRQNAEGQWVAEANAKAITHGKTNATLSTVSGRYCVFDCEQILRASAKASGQVGAPLESAGSFHNGRVTFALSRVGEYGVRGPLGSDDVEKFAMVVGRHDGQGGVVVFDATGRPACWNTLATMMQGQKSIRHTSTVADRVDRLVDDMLRIRAGIDRAKEQDQSLANASMPASKLVGAYLRAWQVVEGPLVGLGGGEVTDKEADRLFRARQVVSAWMANMDDERQTRAGLQGTLWAAFQSVTQWSNHEAPVRPGAAHPNARQARLFGATVGAGASKAGKFVNAVRAELVGAL